MLGAKRLLGVLVAVLDEGAPAGYEGEHGSAPCLGFEAGQDPLRVRTGGRAPWRGRHASNR